jgi:hypothetical protein
VPPELILEQLREPAPAAVQQDPLGLPVQVLRVVSGSVLGSPAGAGAGVPEQAVSATPAATTMAAAHLVRRTRLCVPPDLRLDVHLLVGLP